MILIHTNLLTVHEAKPVTVEVVSLTGNGYSFYPEQGVIGQ